MHHTYEGIIQILGILYYLVYSNRITATYIYLLSFFGLKLMYLRLLIQNGINCFIPENIHMSL